MTEPTTGQAFWVYAIVLSKDVLKEKRFIAANPDYVKGAHCYYVGASSRDPYTRFLQHKRGHKASKWVKKYGRYVAPKKCRQLRAVEEGDRAKAERAHAERLRKKGYGVWWN